MGKEIEFKYLVKKLPDSLEQYKKSEIEQVYIFPPNSNSETVYRLRKMDGKLFYCEKSSGLLQRDEFEYEIDLAKYETLLKYRIDNLIKKTRYYIPLGYDNLIAELDIYYNNLETLKTVEVEFTQDYDLASFIPPSWFGKDVTLDAKFKNANLAKLSSIVCLQE